MNFFDIEVTVSKIVFACFVPSGTGAKIHNSRPSHGLAFNISGKKEYVFDDGTSLTVGANDIIFLPKNSSYIVNDITPGDCYAVNFDILENLDLKPFSVKTKNSEKFLSAFKAIDKSFVSKETGFTSKCFAELYSVISLLILENNISYTPDKIKTALMPAIEYIHLNYTKEAIIIEHLSAICKMSPSYFRRNFFKCFACSPINYINNLKLARAKELLSQNEFNLNTVCELSGFNNVYYFCRFFKKHTGLTPGQYKNGH